MNLKASITNTIARTTSSLKAKSPEIILGASIVGLVTAGVTACIATTKLQPILDEHKEALNAVEEENKKAERGEISKVNKDRLTTFVYVRTGLKVMKLYGPSLGLAALSIAGVCKSNRILRKENAALIGSLTATEKAFENYREGVIERFGKEIDEQLRYGIHQEEFEEEKVDDDGNKKKVKQTLNIVDPDKAGSPYVRYITESHPMWQTCGGNEEYLLYKLNAKQCMWNDTVKARPERFVSINEVYADLNFDPVTDLMMCGWEYEPSDKGIDQYIEFDVREVVLPDQHGQFHRAFAIDFNAHNVYMRRKERQEKLFQKRKA